MLLHSYNDSMSDCPEIDFILRCARPHLNEADVQCIQSRIAAAMDWQFLLEMAARQGVLPLLYWNLKTIGSEAIPPKAFEQLQISFQQNMQQNVALTQELILLLKLFEQAGIVVLPFKGPVLAATVYGNFALRQTTDLDLLVHEQDLSIAAECLATAGYQLQVEVPWESHLTRCNGLYNIDLHSSIAPQHLSYPLQSEDVWQHTMSAQFGGMTVNMLQPEMQLLMLCLHGTKDGWTSLNRICDIAALIRAQPPNWQAVITRANAQGWRRLIGIGLVLAQSLLGSELSEEVQKWLRKDPAIYARTVQIRQQLFSPTITPRNEVDRAVFHLQTRERWQAKIATFWGLMNHSGWFSPTSNDRLFLELPATLTFLYYLIRPIRVLSKYWGSLRGKV